MKLTNGQVVEVQGSASAPYQIKCVGEVVSCSCPAWKNQSLPINKRTCKHIRKVCGDDVEFARIGGSLTMRAPKTKEGGKVQAVPPALLLANKWTSVIDPTGYWMSEKLDGVRAVWTGTELLSRLGNKFHAPTWFTDGLGKEKLDGELWIGRKMFSETISTVKTMGLDKEWTAITYKIFDLPDCKLPFEGRVAKMKKLRLPKYCEVVEQTLCKGITDLQDTLKKYEVQGGEGVMLRLPESMYEGRRSSTLLKVKSFFDDEAVIIGYVDGKGRHAGKVGAYECKMKNGNKFSCGSGLTDKERDKPLAIGTKITFGYCEITKDGIPRFPTYIGEAIDK